jgi:hypothetical protein
MKLFCVEMDYVARDPIDFDYHPARYYVVAEDEDVAKRKVDLARQAKNDKPGGRDAKVIRVIEMRSFVP